MIRFTLPALFFLAALSACHSSIVFSRSENSFSIIRRGFANFFAENPAAIHMKGKGCKKNPMKEGCKDPMMSEEPMMSDEPMMTPMDTPYPAECPDHYKAGKKKCMLMNKKSTPKTVPAMMENPECPDGYELMDNMCKMKRKVMSPCKKGAKFMMGMCYCCESYSKILKIKVKGKRTYICKLKKTAPFMCMDGYMLKLKNVDEPMCIPDTEM